VDLGTFQNASSINVVRSALIWNNTGPVGLQPSRLQRAHPQGGGLQFVSAPAAFQWAGRHPIGTLTSALRQLGQSEHARHGHRRQPGRVSQITFASLGPCRGRDVELQTRQRCVSPLRQPRVFFTSAPSLSTYGGIIPVGYGLGSADQSRPGLPPMTRPPASATPV